MQVLNTTAASDPQIVQKITTAISDLDGKVATFATLLVKEAVSQQEEKKKDAAKDQITVTGTSCKPS